MNILYEEHKKSNWQNIITNRNREADQNNLEITNTRNIKKIHLVNDIIFQIVNIN